MKSGELEIFLSNQGVTSCDGIQMDENYIHPTRGWLFATFAEALADNLFELGLSKWAAEAWDCDNFATTAYVFAQACHARTSHDSDAGLAFGIFLYHPSAGGGHAINFAVIYEGNPGVAKLVFFEPQTGQEVKLKPDEMVGATYII